MPGYNLTRTEAEERARIIQVQGYDITVDLTSTKETFSSTTVIQFTCAELGASTFLDLIAPKVRRVTLNGTDLDPADVYADCRIQLANLQATNEVVVEADVAYSRTGEGLHRFTDPVDSRTYTYTQFEVADARRVFAGFEQPDMKSRFTFHIIAPQDWAVISNMPAPEPVECAVDDTPALRWDFPQTPVMSTYLTAIIAGPYVKWESTYPSTDGRDVPMGVYIRESMAQYMDADEVFDITRRGFEFYEKSFGIPYPYDKYDQAFVPEYNASAMENIGAVTLTETRYVFRSKPVQAHVDARANTILHEQAHMWFGDLVTMKWWNDLWLNESFAEFMAHYAAVNNTRWVDGWTDFLATRKLRGYEQDQLPTTHPIVANIRDLADVEVNFDMITYAKGASVIKQLVAWVGEEAFLTGVHNYLTKNAWGNATLADFLAEVSAASGRDLTQWSKVWLEEAGVTTLRPVVEASVAGVYSRVAIAQEVPPVYAGFADIPHRDLPAIEVHPSLRPHHIRIGGYGFGAHAVDQLWSLEADIAGELTEIPELTGQIIPDLLVINDGDLAYAKLRMDAGTMGGVKRLIGKIGDPLTRSLLWVALWDCVRDSEMKPSDYIELVLSAASDETSSMGLMSLLAHMRQCVSYYVQPEARKAIREDAATRLLTLAMEADPGSDAQLQFFTSFAVEACTPSQWSFLSDQLDGAGEVDGLVIDTDLRWSILGALVAAGIKGEDDIDAELTRDNTMDGQVMAHGLRAEIPTVEAKRHAWQLAVHDESISNATQREIIARFPRVSDPTLLRDFATLYFASIEQVWDERTREMAGNIVRGLFPMWALNDPEVNLLEMVDEFLARLGADKPALRRLILTHRQEVICALVARAADTARH